MNTKPSTDVVQDAKNVLLHFYNTKKNSCPCPSCLFVRATMLTQMAVLDWVLGKDSPFADDLEKVVRLIEEDEDKDFPSDSTETDHHSE